jgi:RNA polymerase primary sigma factor
MSILLASEPRPLAATQADPLLLAALLERPLVHIAGMDYDGLSEDAIEWSRFGESTRLVQSEEQHLFRQMNLAYFRASQLRDQLSADFAPQDLFDEAQRLVERGTRIRNRLLIVFRKLALAIARSFVRPRFAWDELCSEAEATLLYAIGKFDPDRGFRFSTYATHAIRRRLVRYVRQQGSRGEVVMDFGTSRLAESRKWTFSYEQHIARSLDAVERLLRGLTPRERYVVRARFGWGREFEPRTLQQIADEFGVSRERVRQLESRALRKLRGMASELGLEE